MIQRGATPACLGYYAQFDGKNVLLKLCHCPVLEPNAPVACVQFVVPSHLKTSTQRGLKGSNVAHVMHCETLVRPPQKCHISNGKCTFRYRAQLLLSTALACQ